MEDINHNISHYPVMLNEVLDYLKVDIDKRYLDCTFGCGGYTKALLSSGSQVDAVDRDINALDYTQNITDDFPGKFRFKTACFDEVATQYNNQKYDGIVFDLGVSSVQIDSPERGFSFRFDGPLDMRMGNSSMTAFDVVNSYQENKLADILYQYGEEKKSRSVAKAIVIERNTRSINTTLELANIIRKVVPRSKDGIDPATRSFQALRIYVNDELGQLQTALANSLQLLKNNGRLVVVSFHSLEDRIVKHFMQSHSNYKAVNRYLPKHKECPNILKIITKKPIVPTQNEVLINKRSSSAKLRCAQIIKEI